MYNQPKIWVLQSSHTGDTNNRRAIAQAISPDNYQLINGSIERNLLGYANKRYKNIEDLPPTAFPDLFITCEQQSYDYSNKLKQYSHGSVFTVGLQAPDIDSNDFIRNAGQWNDYQLDMLVLFKHHETARLSSPFSHAVKGIYNFAPTYITQDHLHKIFNSTNNTPPFNIKQPGPVFLLTLGSIIDTSYAFGKSNWQNFPRDVQHMADNIIALLGQVTDAVQKTNGFLLVTTSRRTEDFIKDILKKQIACTPHYIHDWTKEKEQGTENPYLQMLSTADRIIVTADSISMMSDALATGKPTFTYVASHNPDKTPQKNLERALSETQMLRIETKIYMQKLAEEKCIHPMYSLARKALKKLPPVNSAPQIASDILNAYRKFQISRPEI